MPRPRFQKLDDERRDNMMEAAAKVFAKEGYQGASINQILQNAGLSKGVAYYYFEDKADLFATTVEFYLGQIDTSIISRIDELNAENFWKMLLELYSQPFLQNIDTPYRFRVLKVATQIPADDPLMERIAPLMQMAFGWTSDLISKGQEFGLVRDDLPEELLSGFITGIDTVSDDYILERLETMSHEDILQTLSYTVDAIKRLLSP